MNEVLNDMPNPTFQFNIVRPHGTSMSALYSYEQCKRIYNEKDIIMRR